MNIGIPHSVKIEQLNVIELFLFRHDSFRALKSVFALL